MPHSLIVEHGPTAAFGREPAISLKSDLAKIKPTTFHRLCAR